MSVEAVVAQALSRWGDQLFRHCEKKSLQCFLRHAVADGMLLVRWKSQLRQRGLLHDRDMECSFITRVVREGLDCLTSEELLLLVRDGRSLTAILKQRRRQGEEVHPSWSLQRRSSAA